MHTRTCVCGALVDLCAPPLEILPPPPEGGGRETITSLFCRQYLLRWFVFPICHTHVLALLSRYFKSVTCVYSVIFSLQRRCTGCHVPFSDPRCFLPVTVHGTTHPHWVHMCWPLLWGLHQMGRSSATFGTYALVGSLKWIMRALNSQGSRLWLLHHPSCFTCALFACISGGYHNFALNYPPPPPLGVGRPSRAAGGDFNPGGGGIRQLTPKRAHGAGRHSSPIRCTHALAASSNIRGLQHCASI